MRVLILLLLLPVAACMVRAGEGENPPSDKTEEKRQRPAAVPATLSQEQLKRLDEIIAKREGRDRVSLEDNVLIRVQRFETTRNLDRVREVLLQLVGDEVEVQGRGDQNAPAGLRLRYEQIGPSLAAGATLESMIEEQLGSEGHEVSLITQVGKAAYVQVLTRSAEVWDAELRMRQPPGVVREPILLEHVIGTGLRLYVRAANEHAVILRIMPYFTSRKVDGPREQNTRTLVEDLETTVRVRPGEAILLGGLTNQLTRKMKDTFSNRERGGTRSSMIVLRAERHATLSGALPPEEKRPGTRSAATTTLQRFADPDAGIEVETRRTEIR